MSLSALFKTLSLDPAFSGHMAGAHPGVVML
jgi:hypothetical protein